MVICIHAYSVSFYRSWLIDLALVTDLPSVGMKEPKNKQISSHLNQTSTETETRNKNGLNPSN